MSLSEKDPISPTEKNQEQGENPQDSSKNTEKKIVSREPHHETSPSSVSPMNTTNEEEAFMNRHDSFSENPNYITMNSRNMLNPFGNMLKGSLDSVGSKRYLDSIQMMPNPTFFNKNDGDQSQLNVEASSNNDVFYDAPTMPRLQHNHESQMSVDLSPDMQQQMINSSINGSGTGFTNSIRNLQHDYGEGYCRNNSESFRYQSNSFLGSRGNNASMSSPEMLLHNPESQMSVSRMQQKISNESIYGCDGMNAESVDSEMQTECKIYDTNNIEVFGYKSNSFLGSGGNNETISSQGDSGQNVMMPIPGGNNISINSDQEALTSHIESFWENPYYHESDNITMNTGNLLMNPSGGMLGGFHDSAGSQIDPDPVQMMPTFGDVKNNNDLASGERYGTNLLGYQSNIPFGSIESMMNAKRDKEEIHMIPTPSSDNRAQWHIKKILTRSDLASPSRLNLQKSLFEQYLQKHLPEAEFQELVSSKSGILITVYDHDKHTTHGMRLALRGDNYVLMGEWRKAFIERRSLRAGQEIGLFLDSSDSRLHFSVLNLEIAKVPAKDKKPLVQ